MNSTARINQILSRVLIIVALVGVALLIQAVSPASALNQRYTNDTYRFSLMMPAGFTVGDMPPPDVGGTEAFVLQNADAHQGIDLDISPWDEPASALTVERIEQDNPGVHVSDAVAIAVGNDATGLQFRDDDEGYAPGGSSDIYFVYHGYLYQLSSMKSDEPLLRAMFRTWRFFLTV